MSRETDFDLGFVQRLSGEQTCGALAIVEHPMAPGVIGAPIHTHSREDECSYVLEGRVVVRVGDREIEAGPGELVWKPRGVPHAFWNPGPERARLGGGRAGGRGAVLRRAGGAPRRGCARPRAAGRARRPLRDHVRLRVDPGPPRARVAGAGELNDGGRDRGRWIRRAKHRPAEADRMRRPPPMPATDAAAMRTSSFDEAWRR